MGGGGGVHVGVCMCMRVSACVRGEYDLSLP